MNNSFLQLTASKSLIVDFIIKSLSQKNAFYSLSAHAPATTLVDIESIRTIEFRLAHQEPIWMLLRELMDKHPEFNFSYQFETFLVRKTKQSFFVRFTNSENSKRLRTFDEVLRFFCAGNIHRLAA